MQMMILISLEQFKSNKIQIENGILPQLLILIISLNTFR